MVLERDDFCCAKEVTLKIRRTSALLACFSHGRRSDGFPSVCFSSGRKKLGFPTVGLFSVKKEHIIPFNVSVPWEVETDLIPRQERERVPEHCKEEKKGSDEFHCCFSEQLIVLW